MAGSFDIIIQLPNRRERRYRLDVLQKRYIRFRKELGRYDAIRRTFYFLTEDEATRRGADTLTLNQCEHAEDMLRAYIARLNAQYEVVKEYSPLMQAFPGMTWDALDRLGPEGRTMLHVEARKLDARRKLESIQLLSAAFATKAPREWYLHLAELAYGDDPKAYAQAVHAIASIKQ